MKKNIIYRRSQIKRQEKLEGETIENKVRRIMENKEPIKDGAPEIFTERKDGVMAGYNIRTDRFELATEVMDKVHKSKIAKRESNAQKDDKVIDINKGKKEGDSAAESIQGKVD